VLLATVCITIRSMHQASGLLDRCYHRLSLLRWFVRPVAPETHEIQGQGERACATWQGSSPRLPIKHCAGVDRAGILTYYVLLRWVILICVGTIA
jgi:hypothetical protein